jgi:hypothetical protein
MQAPHPSSAVLLPSSISAVWSRTSPTPRTGSLVYCVHLCSMTPSPDQCPAHPGRLCLLRPRSCPPGELRILFLYSTIDFAPHSLHFVPSEVLSAMAHGLASSSATLWLARPRPGANSFAKLRCLLNVSDRPELATSRVRPSAMTDLSSSSRSSLCLAPRSSPARARQACILGHESAHPFAAARQLQFFVAGVLH